MRTKLSTIPEAKPVLNYIRTRLNHGLYTLALVTGLPGSGKSSTCLRLKELIYASRKKSIDMTKKMTCDNLLDLVEAIRDSKPGDVIVVEELSVLFPSRRAMSTDNVSIGRILDTCRKKEVILITNAPILPSVDSHIRALANILVETLRVDRSQQVVVSKAFRLNTDVRTSKTYLHRFTKKGKDINFIYTKKPGTDIWDKYENEKDGFIDKLYAKLHFEQVKKGDKENLKLGIPGTLERPLTPKEMEAYDLYMRQGKTMTEIAKIVGCSISTISSRLKYVNKKLHILGDFKALAKKNKKIPKEKPIFIRQNDYVVPKNINIVAQNQESGLSSINNQEND